MDYVKQENLYMPRSIRTVSGNYVNVFEPNPDTITIEDIAHALSFQCRFGAHMKKFYTVAQHSLAVMQDVDNPDLKLQALMHDASEAYLLDIPSPIKKELHAYYPIEENLMNVIAKKFGFTWPMHQDVVESDKRMLEYEWVSIKIAADITAPIFTKAQANKFFLQNFKRLTK